MKCIASLVMLYKDMKKTIRMHERKEKCQKMSKVMLMMLTSNER